MIILKSDSRLTSGIAHALQGTTKNYDHQTSFTVRKEPRLRYPATLLAALLCMSPSLARSDDLIAVPPPPPRAYSYKILEVQPGQIAADLVPNIETHLGGSLSPMVSQQVVTSPAGRRFEADLTVGYETSAVSLYTTMGDDPYELVKLVTATPALEGRVIAIRRNIRKPNAELPEPAEIFAQLEGLYGKPSWTNLDRDETPTVLYVWTPEGQMPPQAEQPCGHADYDGYEFKPERPPTEYPECSAIFSFAYESKAGQSTLYFHLIDLDLARMDTSETDKQIRSALEGDMKPSDMKL